MAHTAAARTGRYADGEEAVQRTMLRGVRDHHPDDLFVTGDCPPEGKALAHGWLAKPYDPRHLAQAITIIDQLLQGDAPKRLPSGLTLFDRAT